MKTTVNFLIVNMAVSDLLNTILVVPKSITRIFTYSEAWFITGEMGDASCRIVHFLQDVTVAVSLLKHLFNFFPDPFSSFSCATCIQYLYKFHKKFGSKSEGNFQDDSSLITFRQVQSCVGNDRTAFSTKAIRSCLGKRLYKFESFESVYALSLLFISHCKMTCFLEES